MLDDGEGNEVTRILLALGPEVGSLMTTVQILDNLTITIVMTSLMRKLLSKLCNTNCHIDAYPWTHILSSTPQFCYL